MVDLNNFIEVTLEEQDDFLKVRETLTRIGVSSRKEKVLYQSCHILHKQGKYYIVHFKELFALDGKPSNISENDIQRRNAIAKLLEEWGLLNLANKIRNYKKGFYIHYKFEGNKTTLDEFEKKIKIDNSVIRYLIVKYKKLDTKNEFFKKNN